MPSDINRLAVPTPAKGSPLRRSYGFQVQVTDFEHRGGACWRMANPDICGYGEKEKEVKKSGCHKLEMIGGR
jgi:hypothetical protein